MGWSEILKAIGAVVGPTMALLAEKEKKKIYDDHHEILKEIEDAKNSTNYYNSDVDNSRIRLRLFLEAYGALLGSKNLGTLSGQASPS